ncbi:MAG: DUF3849 domain-containing protein [Firmicutes bacterium]|nr:DUF3849 domain-containing protein [Bacillota bacterium]
MPDFKPLYRYSFNEAKRLNELDEWQDSFAENRRCRDFIDEQVRQNFDGMHLGGDIPQKTIAEFGFDRTRWVLANHIQFHDYDGRFSPWNKAWAADIYIPRPAEWELKKDPSMRDDNTGFLLDSHSVLVDYLAGQVRQMYDRLNLYDQRHREPGEVHEQDFTDKVLILRDTVLKESARTPGNQLFLANGGGFGCSPHASGRAVMGEFLIDGEKARFNRSDFIGICDENYLPDWAREKLAELCPADAPDPSQGPTMKGM